MSAQSKCNVSSHQQSCWLSCNVLTQVQYVSSAQLCQRHTALSIFISAGICKLNCSVLAQVQSDSSAATCLLGLSAQLQPVVICVLSCHMCPHLSSVHSSVYYQVGCELFGWLQSVSLVVMCQLSCHALAQVQAVSARQLLLSAQLQLVSFPF